MEAVNDRPRVNAEALFGALWDALVSLLGTTATATLLRRAVSRATAGTPELRELRIAREGLEYTYAVPPSWRDPEHVPAVIALRRLFVEELEPLLRELTGAVVRRHLARIPELRPITGPPEEEEHER